MKRLLLSSAAAALLAGCAAPQAAEPLRVAKTLGSRQCEAGGTTLEALRTELERAGVRVARAACGSDGRMRVQRCGASDGRIGLFEIAAADREAAARLGFAPAPSEATEQPCR